VTMSFAIATQPVEGKHLGVATARDQCLVEKVAFTSNSDLPALVENGGEIYLMNPDGTDIERSPTISSLTPSPT
jgi:hypothetical protein